MLKIALIGLNHNTASVDIRECLAFSKDEYTNALHTFINFSSVKEVIIISTCNRVEILLATDNQDSAIDQTKKYLSDAKNIPISQFENSLYTYVGDDAVNHLFRVAASLDSMIVGEPQILGQIKEAYRVATAKKTSGVILNRLLHKTFFVAKRVRHETGIGDNAVSISYAAVELAKKIFGSLDGRDLLLIGAGEMAELAVEHLIRNQTGDIFVANRTFERAVELAQRFNGKPVQFQEIPDYIQTVDIIISSTGSPAFIIHKDQIKKTMRQRKNRPIFFIDIAVPRDIDPQINRVNNAYLYDIDDLKGVIEENIEDRMREAVKAERIIEEAVIRFRQWFDSLDVVPTIVDLRKKIEKIAQNELKRTFKAMPHLGKRDREAIQKMSESLTNKILHDPTLFLKNGSSHGNKALSLDMTRKLFNLDYD